MAEIKLKIKEFKKMKDPRIASLLSEDVVKYVGYVKCNEITDELLEWMETNPREQNLKTKVSKDIENTLISDKGLFHTLNRGMVFSVENISWDNKTEIAKIELNDKFRHGNIDGGHTLRIIIDNIDAINDNKYVFCEFFVGLKDVTDLAESRNKSQQINETSIEELRHSFDSLKKVIEDEEFYNRITYKQNTSIDNAIDITEIIAVINMFNIKLYPNSNENFPIKSYNGRAGGLKDYLSQFENEDARDKFYEKYKLIISNVFKLWDQIELEIPTKLKSKNKKYGTKPYSKYNNGEIIGKTKYYLKDRKYEIPGGLMFPLVGAFRALVIYKDEKYQWEIDPFEVWDELGATLSESLMEISEGMSNNPNAIGKSKNAWSFLYSKVRLYCLEKARQ